MQNSLFYHLSILLMLPMQQADANKIKKKTSFKTTHKNFIKLLFFTFKYDFLPENHEYVNFKKFYKHIFTLKNKIEQK